MLKILRIEENKYRNIYVISDIHAHGDLLEKLLEKIEYSKEDLFLILGDSCDRGNELEKTYEILFKLQKESNLIHLIGNHEKMLEDYYMGIERETYLINENDLESILERLVEIEIKGLGLRKNEGFGKVRICSKRERSS